MELIHVLHGTGPGTVMVWAHQEIVKPLPGTCLKLGAHRYSVIETTYRHRRTLLGKGEQSIMMTVGLMHGDPPSAQPWFLPTHVCRHVKKN